MLDNQATILIKWIQVFNGRMFRKKIQFPLKWKNQAKLYFYQILKFYLALSRMSDLKNF